MKVLITGVAGFIGAAAARALLARGDSVVGIDNLNDYYPVALKRARLAAVEAAAEERFTFIEVDSPIARRWQARSARKRSMPSCISGRRQACAIRSRTRTPMSSLTSSAISTCSKSPASGQGR